MKINLVKQNVSPNGKSNETSPTDETTDTADFFDLINATSISAEPKTQSADAAPDLSNTLNSDLDNNKPDTLQENITAQLQQQMLLNLNNEALAQNTVQTPDDNKSSQPQTRDNNNIANDAPTTSNQTSQQLAIATTFMRIKTLLRGEPSQTQNQVEPTDTAPNKTTIKSTNTDDIPLRDLINSSMATTPVNTNAHHADLTNLPGFMPTNEKSAAQDDQQNKYVTALKQMSDFINGHTQKLFPADTAFKQINADDISYTKMATNLQRAEPEVKIELHGSTMDSLKNEAYTANIKIYPPELGRVTVKLRLEKNNAELQIMAENNHVKEIIQTNMAQLRESFLKQDINLSQINVEVQSSQSDAKEKQQSSQRDANSAEEANLQLLENTPQQPEPTGSPRNINSIIDTYA